MSRLFSILLVLLLSLATTNVFAQRVLLEEVLSPNQTYAVDLQWNAAEIKRALSVMMSGGSTVLPPLLGRVSGVEVRLDTRAYVGQRARLFLVLPILVSGVDSPSDLELRWEVSGPFLSGAVRPGQSTLIYEGAIDEPVTGMVMDFLLALENGGAADAFSLEPVYEIELLP
ncbi:MAG: hypothetical protein ACR2QB_08360 [Gammaproteobacteria bacterium]